MQINVKDGLTNLLGCVVTVPKPPITMNATSIMLVVTRRFARRGTLLPRTTETNTATTCSTLVMSDIVNLPFHELARLRNFRRP